MDWKLNPRTDCGPPPGPVVIAIMDGVGIGKGDDSDAVALARTPTLDSLRDNAPGRRLKAHGTAVGLPSDSIMGNSEVGHNALGAGRIFDQGAKLVARAFADGSLFAGETWRRVSQGCIERRAPLHLIGLLSDGNVHSHIAHLICLVEEAARIGLHEVYCHVLLDGRDVEDGTAPRYVEQLESVLTRYDNRDGRRFRIASGGGRMVTTMDRYEADWSIVARGWGTHVHGTARPFRSALDALRTFRSEDPKIQDQNLPAFTIVDESGDPVGRIRDGAGVIFFNYRGDRAIEISRAFEEEDFPYFDRGDRPKVDYAGLMQYDGDFLIPKSYLVAPPMITRTMGEYLARNGIAQLACSETQKYGHVTYFWNGNRGGKFDERLETYVEVPSNSPPFDDRPWMKAAEITDAVIAEMRTRRYGFVRLNYANGDMVGHTGNRIAAIYAVEAVDLSLGRLLAAVDELGGIAIVTADHGNADDMYERDDGGGLMLDKRTGLPKIRVSHTLNPVPFYIHDSTGAWRRRLRDDLPGAGLANIAATALHLMGLHAPDDYEPDLLS